MNIQTILENRKQREIIDDALCEIYSSIIENEMEFSRTLSKQDHAVYSRIHQNYSESERPFGRNDINFNVFCLETDEIEIFDDCIKAKGCCSTQAGNFYDPITIPAALIEAYGTEEWKTVLNDFMQSRWNSFEKIIKNERRAEQSKKKKNLQQQEKKERETYERLRLKYESKEQ